MNNIIELKETSENQWRAKYQGNYGVYTIKISLDKNEEKKRCSCPSDYSPCKHIAIVENAIAARIAENKNKKPEKTLTVTQILKNVSFNDLRKFIVQHSKYNTELTNAIVLEFSHKIRKDRENPYSLLLRKALKKLNLDDGYYDQDYCEIEPLDEWFEKAKKCLREEKYEEAILICQACLEEFANWFGQSQIEIGYFENYNSYPFEILCEIAKKNESFHKELYDYCKSEKAKSIYREASVSDCFDDLMAVVASQNNYDDFLAQQDDLLKNISDQSSYEAQKILQRKVDFYKRIKQPKKAKEIIETNLQIEEFCRETAKERIAGKKYAEAKKIIADFLKQNPSRYRWNWNEYILEIAQKERDVPTIRSTAYEFIQTDFNQKYYEIYKSTFTPKEWQEEIERLTTHYDKNSSDYSYTDNSGFKKSVADLLVAENLQERLITYIEKHLSAEAMEQYHTAFAKQFPNKTLELYQKALNEYAKNYMGRDRYEYIRKQLQKMKQIEHGDLLVAKMTENYRQIYKNRPAMIDVLKKL
ncbi:MAG: SWIM zinc finger family protein [Planctomycetaceae bacterium]|jgi:hypothetical protein|nr:SWIM zinc finger family protein [Planctomycetaceae bacterium]